MAFCNSCGATLNAGTKFCNKCGAAVAATPVTPAVVAAPLPPAPPASQGGGSSALKIILIIIAIIVGLGILSVGAFSFFVYRVAKSAKVSPNGDVKVETPFGKMETSSNPEQVAKDLGIDIYPGATALKNGAVNMSFGSMHTVAASFESTDPVDKICDFYKSRLPNATATSSDQRRCSLISNDQKNMITVNVQSEGETSKFQISNVSKK